MKSISVIMMLALMAVAGYSKAFAEAEPESHSFYGRPERKPVIAKEKTEPEISPKEAGFIEQVSYSLGFDIFRHINGQVDLDLDFFLAGVKDANHNTPRLDREQMKQMLMAYQRLARQKARDDAKAVLEKNRAEADVFLEGNKLKEGVVTLSSGLQYKVVKEGEGPVPGPENTVECHYRGTLIDGTEFDSSHARGRPAVFEVGQMIKGWAQALTRMPVGAKWMLYIPPDLAYGDEGAGDAIEPGSALIFEVELLGIMD